MPLTAADFDRVGKMLSDKFGITVTCEGTDCCTNGKVIKLPALPTHIDSERLLSLIRSWLDHEVGHIVGESDFDLAVEIGEKHGQAGHSIANALEDIRIEQIMADMWAGCEINLRVGVSETLAQLEEKSKSTERASKDPDNPTTVGDCVRHPLKQLGTALFLIGKGVPVPQWIEQDILDLATKANAKFNVEELSLWCKKTRELVPAVEWILDEYKKLRQQRDEAGKDQGGPTTVKVVVKKGDGGGDGLSQEAAESINKADNVQVEYDDSETPAGGGEDAESQDSNGDPPAGFSVPSPGQQGGDAAPPKAQDSPKPQPSKSPEQIEAEERLAMEIAGDISQSVSQAIQDEMTLMSEADPHGMRRPWAAGIDRLVKAGSTSPTEAKLFSDKSSLAGGPMRQRLSQLLQAEAKVWWRGGRPSGSPDPRRIAMLATGISTDVMRKRFETQAPNTACYLMIDGSGSMDGERMEKACLAAGAFGGVLDLCGHEAAISAFVGGEYADGGSYYDRVSRPRPLGIRNYGVHFADVKRFGEPYRQCVPRLAALQNNQGGGTPLGEAIMFAADQLMPRKEKRRVILAFTDGQPNDSEYAKWACKYCEGRGVEVVLVGIQSDAVERLHDKHAVCDDIAKLSTTTMVQLTKALRRRR